MVLKNSKLYGGWKHFDLPAHLINLTLEVIFKMENHFNTNQQISNCEKVQKTQQVIEED